MTWESFYLICFFVGLILSALSFFSGAFHLHLPTKFHVPHALQHGGVARLGTLKSGGACAQTGSASDIPFFNMSSIMAFLCWFGGMGYLLTHYSTMFFALAFVLSALTGLGGAAIVFWFLVKVILAHESPLDSEDFEMVGIVGSVSSSIRAGGTGEIVFLQQGTRRSAGARSADGAAIAKGAEVVVTRHEKGIAYVRPWSEFAEENRIATEEAQPKVQ
jgi:membrane protein implicated in regulation of membrane protease activity